MALTWKTLLLRRENWAVSGGLMVAVPTAEDTRVDLPDGTPLVAIRDRSTHLAPFVGFLWTPNERFFAQGFAQWDVEANPNPVFINQVSFNDGVMNSRVWPMPATFTTGPTSTSTSATGWWLYRGHDRFRHLTGLALTAELHWDQALKEGNAVTNGNWVIGGFTTGSDEWNATIGAAHRVGQPDDRHDGLLHAAERRAGPRVRRRVPADAQSPLRRPDPRHQHPHAALTAGSRGQRGSPLLPRLTRSQRRRRPNPGRRRRRCAAVAVGSELNDEAKLKRQRSQFPRTLNYQF